MRKPQKLYGARQSRANVPWSINDYDMEDRVLSTRVNALDLDYLAVGLPRISKAPVWL